MRDYFFPHMLGPAGLVEEKFGCRIDVPVRGIQKQSSDRFAKFGTAGFAGVDNVKSPGLKISDDLARLGGLPASFRTL